MLLALILGGFKGGKVVGYEFMRMFDMTNESHLPSLSIYMSFRSAQVCLEVMIFL
jgi:hypothetical protein